MLHVSMFREGEVEGHRGVLLGARGDVRLEVTFVLLDSLNMHFRREQQ